MDDIFWFQQQGMEGATNYGMACESVAVSHAVRLLTRDSRMTPDSLANETETMFGADAYGYDGNPDRLNYQRLLAMCAARYGLRWKSIPDSNSRWVDVRNALRQGHMIVAGQAAGGPLFVTADGGTRPYTNGHTIMFYRYANGRFYAKDSSPVGGGPAIPYPTDVAMDWFSTGFALELWID